MDELLKQYYLATGNNIENFEKFQGFLSTLAEAESFSGKNQRSKNSTAKGLYHYLDDSVVTSDKRTQNLFKKHNIDAELQKAINDASNVPVGKRTKDMQSIMVLSDLMQGPNAPYQAWTRGEVSDQELYYRGHHTKSKDSISSQEQVYENWKNANTRLNIKNPILKEIKVHDRTKEDYLQMIGKEFRAGGSTDPGKKKLKKVLKDSTGIVFEEDAANRLFGVSGTPNAPVDFGKYTRFFKESGNTVNGARTVKQIGKSYNNKGFKDNILPYLQELNKGVNFNYRGNEFMYGGSPQDITGSGSTFQTQEQTFGGFNQDPKPKNTFTGENALNIANLISNYMNLSNTQQPGPGSTPNVDSSEFSSFGSNPTQSLPFGNNYNFNSGFDSQNFGGFGTGQDFAFGNNLASSNFDVTGGVSPYDLNAGTNFGESSGSGISSNLGALGAYSAIAGGVGSAIEPYLTSQYENENNVNTIGEYDPTSRFGKSAAKEHNQLLESQDTSLGVWKSIPFIGGFVKGGEAIGKGAVQMAGGKETFMGNWMEGIFNPGGSASRHFKDGNTLKGISTTLGNIFSAGLGNVVEGPQEGRTDAETMNDYLGILRPENQRNKKALYSTAFDNYAKYGGAFGGYSEEPASELVEGGLYKVQGNETHDQNVQRGYTFSTNPDGSKNKASAGEVVMDGPGGQKLVFTDEF